MGAVTGSSVLLYHVHMKKWFVGLVYTALQAPVWVYLQLYYRQWTSQSLISQFTFKIIELYT